MELISLLIVIASILVGFDIGANSAANALGVIVGSRTLSFKKAALMMSIFMLLGALLQGGGVTRIARTLTSISVIQRSLYVKKKWVGGR
jgi:PiT family inorganic phosphate transporter